MKILKECLRQLKQSKKLNNEEFIFRVKKGDHKSLYKYIETAEYKSHRTVTGNNVIAHRWYKDVPLNNSSNIKVTVLQAFVITNIPVEQQNVAALTKAARARWHIENQCFNALKNSGYELTHNWGHVKGESFSFYILIMLAFYIHQILELTDQLFQWCRESCGTYQML